MVKLILFLLLLILIIGGGIFFLRPTKTAQTPTPAPSSEVSPTQGMQSGAVLCEPEALSGSLTTEPAAGNIYGTLTLTNSSNTPCNVTLGSSVTAIYSAKNITLKYQPAPTPHEITLQPNEKAYSQVHYPNGPQCSGSTAQQQIQFLYEVDGKTVPFTQEGQKSTAIQACSSTSDVTTIDIWPLSQNQITQ